jgi:hypothetical protein
MTTTTPRKRRPMIEMTGFVGELQLHDFVDEIGGDGWKRFRVGKLVHRVDQRDLTYDEEMAWRLQTLPGVGPRRANRAATTPAHARIEWTDGSHNALLADCPVKFRRFAD